MGRCVFTQQPVVRGDQGLVDAVTCTECHGWFCFIALWPFASAFVRTLSSAENGIAHDCVRRVGQSFLGIGRRWMTVKTFQKISNENEEDEMETSSAKEGED
ncbi:hypothetical protein OUZ56_000439 [Daphnia magna]|uniref:Uncharacterized protein n=1 Tax=Daphnia magna TaxID=35525 RepID=A0ABQ9ZZP1_9CRUS|nr:hypothetical protein OUZ56_000439 [Daphnia magna]